MKEKYLTVGELLAALSQFEPEDTVYVHAEMSLLVECPVIGVLRQAESSGGWQAVIRIEESAEETEEYLLADLN
jgi:hypothetical protein